MNRGAARTPNGMKETSGAVGGVNMTNNKVVVHSSWPICSLRQLQLGDGECGDRKSKENKEVEANDSKRRGLARS